MGARHYIDPGSPISFDRLRAEVRRIVADNWGDAVAAKDDYSVECDVHSIDVCIEGARDLAFFCGVDDGVDPGFSVLVDQEGLIEFVSGAGGGGDWVRWAQRLVEIDLLASVGSAYAYEDEEWTTELPPLAPPDGAWPTWLRLKLAESKIDS